MHRIDSYGSTDAGLYTNGVPAVTPATVADANAMNALQEELAHLVERPPYSGTLTTSDETTEPGDPAWTQVGDALDARYGQLAEPNTWAGEQTLEAGVTTPELATGGLQILSVHPVFNGTDYRLRLYSVEATHVQFSDGGLLLTWNASWDGSAWQPDVSGLPAQATQTRPDGTVRLFRLGSLSAPAGAALFDAVTAHVDAGGMRVVPYVSTAAGPHNSVGAFEGRVAIKAGTNSITINNSAFTTGSIPSITYQSGAVRDTTLTQIWCDMLTGTLNIYGNANATSDVLVAWRVMVPPA